MNVQIFRRACVLVLAALPAISALNYGPVSAAPVPTVELKKKVAFAQFVTGKTSAVLDSLGGDDTFPPAITALRTLFDQVIVHCPDDRLDAFREADFALRLVMQVQGVPAATRAELLPFLRKNDALAKTLIFLIRADCEKPAQIYTLLDKLRQKRADQLDKYANLVAAICVVHNRPLQRADRPACRSAAE